MPIQVTNDTDIKNRVYAQTMYEDSVEELPNNTLDTLLDMAKSRMMDESNLSEGDWFRDRSLGNALVAYTCIRAKAAVENFAVSGYTMGDEQIQTRNADPESSQQIQMWAEDIRVALDASELDTDSSNGMRNTSSFVGESYYYDH